jgi:hypothetical protein
MQATAEILPQPAIRASVPLPQGAIDLQWTRRPASLVSVSPDLRGSPDPVAASNMPGPSAGLYNLANVYSTPLWFMESSCIPVQ